MSAEVAGHVPVPLHRTEYQRINVDSRGGSAVDLGCNQDGESAGIKDHADVCRPVQIVVVYCQYIR